ncbi:MAG: alanyl-tRNA editing protein, partial [Oscillospiraceae bacterium]|nr:alanyl-tRNA editing protein [Oscillospiraceae bacterium]
NRGKGNVLLFKGDMDPNSVRRLCVAVGEVCGGRAAVFAGSGESYKYAMMEENGDLRALTKDMNAALNGRGGGKPFFVQGSVAAGEDAIRNFFEGK